MYNVYSIVEDKGLHTFLFKNPRLRFLDFLLEPKYRELNQLKDKIIKENFPGYSGFRYNNVLYSLEMNVLCTNVRCGPVTWVPPDIKPLVQDLVKEIEQLDFDWSLCRLCANQSKHNSPEIKLLEKIFPKFQDEYEDCIGVTEQQSEQIKEVFLRHSIYRLVGDSNE